MSRNPAIANYDAALPAGSRVDLRACGEDWTRGNHSTG
jgi:hypothetical protein